MSDQNRSMFFRDLFDGEKDSWDDYEAKLKLLATHVETTALNMTKLYRYYEVVHALGRQVYHGTILVLLREIASLLDGVGVLVEKGSVEQCGRLLRSALEAAFYLEYILQEDTERRALAYQVAYFYRQRKNDRRLDPKEDAYKDLIKELEGDQITTSLRVPPEALARIRAIPKEMKDPVYAEVQAEWKRVKRKIKTENLRIGKRGDPLWHSLFDGPTNIRELTKRIKLLSMYLVYEEWSAEVHVSMCFKNIAMSPNEGEVRIKPIRHPEKIAEVCSFVGNLHLKVVKTVFDTFPKGHNFTENFAKHIGLQDWGKLQKELLSSEVIRAPWK